MPIQFRKPAAPAGLQIGSGIGKGLADAATNYMRFKQQAQMNQYHMQQAQAMNALRQMQAQRLLQQSASVNTQKVHAAYLMDKYGITDGATKDQVKNMLKSGNPYDAQFLQNYAQQHGDSLKREDLNPNENKALSSERMGDVRSQGQQIGLQKSQMQEQGRNDRQDTALAARHQDVQTMANRPYVSSNMNSIVANGIKKELQDNNKADQDLILGKTKGQFGMDLSPADVATKRAALKDQRDQLQAHLNDVVSGKIDHNAAPAQPEAQAPSASPSQAGGAPQPPSASVHSWSNQGDAKPNHWLIGPNGKTMQQVNATGDGFVPGSLRPAPDLGSTATPAPQVAPAQPAQPGGPMGPMGPASPAAAGIAPSNPGGP